MNHPVHPIMMTEEIKGSIDFNSNKDLIDMNLEIKDIKTMITEEMITEIREDREETNITTIRN